MQAVLGMILRLPLGADSCKSSINHTSSSLEANLDIYLILLLSLCAWPSAARRVGSQQISATAFCFLLPTIAHEHAHNFGIVL